MSLSPHTEHSEYQSSMQWAALCFLQRHQAEYLGNDQLLFCRAVKHLSSSLEVPLHMAEKLVARAYGELKCSKNSHLLDVDASSHSVAVVTDPGTYASLLLTTGVASIDWIAEQMGHTNGNMIRQHYETWINEDGPDVVGMLQLALKL